MYTDKKHTKRIGLVLSQVPGYSETFFRNKVKGLQSHGFEILLFVNTKSVNDSDMSCVIVPALDFSKKTIFLFTLVQSLYLMLLVNPKRSWRLFQLNRRDGFTLNRNLKLLLQNQHFLKEQLDWLHFGFGTLARDRENIAEAMGAKMGVSFRGFDLYLSPLKHPNCFHLLFKKDIYYHVLAEEMKDSLVKQGVKKDKISVITPAIDVNFFKKSVTANSFQERPLRFTTVARLHWKKGLDYTLEALALLKAKGIDFHYTIVGSGDQYERLVFAVNQLRLEGQVSFVGKLSPQEVKTVYESTDIYLQYSIQEGFCNAVLEAQAMGLLCVVSNAEGLQENVLNEQTGWVVPKCQPQALATCIHNLLALPASSLTSVRSTAAERIHKAFSLKKQQKQFVDFFEK